MMPALSWIADAILVLLLTVTLCMAMRLDRALRVIRRDRGAFETLIANLGSATSAVKLGIEALRGEAERAAEQIERRSEDADKMATDLSFLIEAAERAGLDLEQRLKPGAQSASAPVQISAFVQKVGSGQKPGPKPKPASRKPGPAQKSAQGPAENPAETPASGQPTEIAAAADHTAEHPPAPPNPLTAPPNPVAASANPVATPANPAGDLRELAGITTKRSARLGAELADRSKAAASTFRHDAAVKKAG